MNSPLVSIVIPVYNGSNYLKEAIDSALSQTYKNIEVIVVNDGSTDGGATEQIALSYGDRIRYFSKPNGGVSSALNVGIENMRGEYFSWLSHDDMYLPNKIEAQISALQNSSFHALVVCGVRETDKDSNLLQAGTLINNLRIGTNSWHEALRFMLKYGSYNGCSLLIPKSAFDICGKFDESLRYCQDALMWMKIFLNKFDLIRIEEVCVCNRVHDGQLTQTGRSLLKHDSQIVSQSISPKLSNCDKHSSELLFLFAHRNAVLGNTAAVKICRKEASSAKLFTLSQKLKLASAGAYGFIRPIIRRIYYRFFKRIKTN